MLGSPLPPPETLGSYACAVTTIKMAVVKEGFPDSRLSSEEAMMVHRVFTELIGQVPFEIGRPRMFGSIHSKDAFIINCNDSGTEDLAAEESRWQ